MSREYLRDVLRDIGLPATVGPWGKDEVVPDMFIEYHMEAPENTYADNEKYHTFDRWSFNLYGKTDNIPGYYAKADEIDLTLYSHYIIASRSGDYFPGDGRVMTEFTFQLPH